MLCKPTSRPWPVHPTPFYHSMLQSLPKGVYSKSLILWYHPKRCCTVAETPWVLPIIAHQRQFSCVGLCDQGQVKLLVLGLCARLPRPDMGTAFQHCHTSRLSMSSSSLCNLLCRCASRDFRRRMAAFSSPSKVCASRRRIF